MLNSCTPLEKNYALSRLQRHNRLAKAIRPWSGIARRLDLDRALEALVFKGSEKTKEISNIRQRLATRDTNIFLYDLGMKQTNTSMGVPLQKSKELCSEHGNSRISFYTVEPRRDSARVLRAWSVRSDENTTIWIRYLVLRVLYFN